MWKCYCKAYWKEFLLGGILKMMGDFVGYIGPLGVSVIVNFVAKKHNVSNLINDETVSKLLYYIRRMKNNLTYKLNNMLRARRIMTQH